MNGDSIIYYAYNSGTSSLQEAIIEEAIALWDGIVSIEYSAYSSSIVSFYNNSEDSRAGSWCPLAVNEDTGHVTKWHIEINMAYYDERTVETIAHEFGHAIGLNDLYESYNTDNLMYGYKVERTVAAPSMQDIWGQK